MSADSDQLLVKPTARFPQLDPGTPHLLCTRDSADGYPPRQLNAPVEWSLPAAEYQPVEFTHPKVLAGPVWADPDASAAARRLRPDGCFHSYEPIHTTSDGVTPRNPRGRTGVTGRGMLGKWGANFAADPLVTRIGPLSGNLELIAIQRRDSGSWALPGGMVDPGEPLSVTLARELAEEALGKESESPEVRELERWFQLRFEQSGREVYAGYVDDWRNTDNAWMETRAVHLHLTGAEADIRLTAGDDAGEARWMVVDAEHLGQLYAVHGEIVARAVQQWQASGGVQVRSDGSVVPTR